jgi:hypothetical protein
MYYTYSLNNVSDSIRWSLDFRWQTADKDPGFYDIKEGVRMRSATDPNYEINWDQFDKVDRHKISAQVRHFY